MAQIPDLNPTSILEDTDEVMLRKGGEDFRLNGSDLVSSREATTSEVTTGVVTDKVITPKILNEVLQEDMLVKIARSLNVNTSQVIYSTNTDTVLDNILYMYDAANEVIYAKPDGVTTTGEKIISTSGNQLTTTVSVYIMQIADVYYAGLYSSDPILQSPYSYVNFDRDGTTEIYRLREGVATPYQLDSALNVDPRSDVNIGVFNLDSQDRALSATFLSKVGVNNINRNKAVNILGDSISFGVGIGTGEKVEDHGYAGILRKLLNIEQGATNLGFTPIVPSNETKIHEFIRIPSFGWDTVQDANASHVISGLAFTTTTVGRQIQFVAPTMNRLCTIWYTGQPSGGEFSIKVNGVFHSNVDTSGPSVKQGFFKESGITMTDDGFGKCVIEIEVLSGPVEIIGISYSDKTSGFRVNNFSQPGRKARDVSSYVNNEVTKVGSTVVYALGHNDLNATGSDLSGAIASMEDFSDYCISRNIKVYILDTGWNYPSTNPIRQQWRKMSNVIPNSVLLNFPEWFTADNKVQTSSYLQSTIGFLADSSHPTISGHKNIAESIMSAMGYSNASKKQAMMFNEKWTPLEVLLASGFENRFSLPNGITSESSRTVAAWRRNGNEIQIRAYLRHTAAIPIDTWIDVFQLPDNHVEVPVSTQSVVTQRASGGTPVVDNIAYVEVSSGKTPTVRVKVPTGYTGNTDFIFMVSVPINYYDDFGDYS